MTISIHDCVRAAREQGALSKAEARRLLDLYASYRRHFEADGDPMAPHAAIEALVALLRAEGFQKKRRLALTAQHLEQLEADLTAHRNASGSADIAAASIAKLEHHGTAGFPSAEGRRLAILGEAHARMRGLLSEFRRGAVMGDNLRVGSRQISFRHNRARLDNVVREAFGEDSGDAAARQLARAWTETADWLRDRFNRAGGAIGHLEKWGLPQYHDARALRHVGKEAWIAAIRPRLAPERMSHPLTGRPVTEDELGDVLSEIWDTIATEGWHRREPSMQPFGRGAISGQRAEHRFLVFRSADDWMAYAADFGHGDPFAAMMRHVSMMSRDIAHMEILGPNPNGTIEYLKQRITRAAAGGTPAELSRASRSVARLESMWSHMRGAMETPVGTGVADTMAAARNLVTASVLGSAAISSLSDLGTQMVARRFIGLPAARTIADIVRQFSSASHEEARAAGLILQHAQQSFGRQARYVGTLTGPDWSAYLVDRVLTWSGLTPWTQASRDAMGLAIMHELGRRASLPFDALPAPLRENLLGAWGFGRAEWDAMRTHVHTTPEGLPLLRGPDISLADEGLASRFMEMIHAQLEFATPTSSVRARTLLIGDQRPGTFWGEVMRSFAQFKSFGAVIATVNAQRVAMLIQNPERAMQARGAAYAGALLISTTLFGALAAQLKQIAGGRDPRDMSTGAFWGAAMLQGGGLGIYGDFLFSDVNRYGGSFAGMIPGPTIEKLSEVWQLTAGNAITAAAGGDVNVGRDLTRALRGMTPGGTLWYARLGYERLVLDQLQYLTDPGANRSFKARQTWWRRNTGQDYYWRPGETAPRRGPALAPAFGR